MKLVTITIRALFDDDVDQEALHSVAADAAVQVQEPEITDDGERVPLPPPLRVETEVTVRDQ